ncbi:MAG: hypothetical protein K2K97_04140 [Muribaculaceae bacterium]|nr:hypothetical protein [Muribaculaceae bacterium]
MWEQIWDGIKSIFVGGVKFVVEVAKAAWEVMKFAVKASVWVVAGIFTIAGHLASYVGKTLSKFFTPEKVVVVNKRKLPALVGFLEEEARNEGIAEDPDVLEISQQLNKAVDNQQALIYSIGKDNDGEVAISDPEFISASQYDKKIAEAEDNNQIYIKKIRVAN